MFFIRFILSNFSCLDVSLNIMNDEDFNEINDDLNENSEHLNDNSSLFNVSLNGSIVCDILSPVTNIATQVSPRSAPIGDQFFNSRTNACFCELYHNISFFLVESPTTAHTKRVIQQSLDFNQSYKNLETFSKLVNSTPGATYRIPTTTYKLKKSVNSTVLIQNHICCSICQCFTPTTSNNVLCDACSTSLKTSSSKYFVYIPFADQLKKSVLKHFEKILSYKSSFDEHSNLITDVQSGFQFKKCQANHSESLVLSLTVSTDGAKMYNSSNDSLWPIQVVQNFLPPKMRYISENIIVVGLHRGKPKMKDFFFPFLNELEKIVNEGGKI